MRPMHMTLLVLCLQSPLHGAENFEPLPNCYFVDAVWDKVGEFTGLKCHRASGELKDSQLILRETILLDGAELQKAHQANFKAFAKMVSLLRL